MTAQAPTWIHLERALTLALMHRLEVPGDIVRTFPNGKLAKFIRDHVAIIMANWKRRWPGAEAAIIATALATNNAAKSFAAGKSKFAGWISPKVSKALQSLVAGAYGLSQGNVLKSFGVDTETKKQPKGLIDAATPGPYKVIDRKAEKWLKKDNKFWVRDVWDEGLGDRIASKTNSALQEGLGRKELAKRLKADLAQFAEPTSYWETVSSASMTRARAFGAVSGFVEADAKSFKFVSVIDERRTEICKHLHGRTWTIDVAVKQATSVMDAKTPDEMKAASPWLPEAEVLAMDDAELAAAGVTSPPLHGRCRSTLVAVFD